MQKILDKHRELYNLARIHPNDICVQGALRRLEKAMLYAGGEYQAYIREVYYGVR